MIGRIAGTLIEKKAPDLLIDVGGVGYEVLAPMSTFYQLPAPGQGVILHTHLVVREDAHQLYGFAEGRERELFRALIKVNGVGPKVALAILSGVSVSDFVRLIHNNDVTALTRVPGIGKKTAERLVLDMRDRLGGWQDDGAGATESLQASLQDDSASVSEEAETALIALGYKPAEAARMVVRALKDNPAAERSEEIIRLALRAML
ncbi:Holliday junction branch migration protein RuvA [Pseudohongiella sp. SYSU M77423]|uniref:Holliday junction branch migration protein RuvA n=1 Tax=unclassified Pseudohongiella TaxID=2629611 RepID=UPI000C58857D|nr:MULTISPECIES: Holliday junction branch migration protein RuvA [unclassified Pseudohongiella]MAO39139.1 Holliday junction branch migration protein RuvA [Pseudohongiella sp.]MAY56069.1 Holliday junction branch migration protein RuvA [Gammaproteobacteria bacterium]MBJ54794.1 Holliday junction branch migration protein RuvA [Gammaproteobacteria bacterium]MDH7944906.1 Holliday junction branch migration protein RuvA [Pseudohongiella sp. SYSU M77423]HBN14954.1 Holliday junction branch migration pro